MNTWKMLILLARSCVGSAMLFNGLKYSEPGWKGTRVSIFLVGVFEVLLLNTKGLFVSSCSPQSSREKNTNFIRLFQNSVIGCLQEIHGHDEFFRLFKNSHCFFCYAVRFFPKEVNVGSAFCIQKDL